MTTISSTPLWVDGTSSFGNVRAGFVSTSGGTGLRSIAVSGLSMSGTGNVIAFVTAQSRVPANKATNTGLTLATVSGASTTGFTVYTYNYTYTGVDLYWFAVRNA